MVSKYVIQFIYLVIFAFISIILVITLLVSNVSFCYGHGDVTLTRIDRFGPLAGPNSGPLKD